jgi:diadenosine tetraphosphate (Ap4A) HIT family hydrolase
MPKKCIFCNSNDNWIFENKYFYSIFDIHPVSPGHALIIPKRHVVSLLDLQDKEWSTFKKTLAKTIKLIKQTKKGDLYKNMASQKLSNKSPIFCKKMLEHTSLGKKPLSFNIGVNDGREAGRTIDHLHIQIIPRYKNDIKNPIGGMRAIIPGLGNYKK